MTNIFDSHAHYDDERFDGDRDELLASLPERGVCAIINIGCSLERAALSLQYADRYPYVYATAGIHPEDVGSSDAPSLPGDYIARLRGMAAHPKLVAIGEIGLDYHYEGFDKALQQRVFIEQLELARKLDLPVVIHSRDATGDCMAILREYRPRGVMHCFSGSGETAREVLALGMSISFTGVVTFKNAHKAVDAALAVPIDRLLLETDCPYMAPEPYRGKRCDSAMIAFTAAKLAELKGMETQALIDACTENTRRLFGISDALDRT